MKGKSFFFWKCPKCSGTKKTRNTKKRPQCKAQGCKGEEMILKA